MFRWLSGRELTFLREFIEEAKNMDPMQKVMLRALGAEVLVRRAARLRPPCKHEWALMDSCQVQCLNCGGVQ